MLRRQIRLAVWLIVGMILLPASLEAAADAQQPARPNIVFIMADDLGQETLGCYGGTSYQTPHLDELARSGMRFRHCYSMPVCHPTRTTLLTGRYPFRLGNPGWGTFPPEEEKNTWAHMMRKAGYATAVAGKWQLILMKNNPQHPHLLGFDDYSLFAWHEGPRYFDPMIYQNGRLREGLEGRYGPDVYVEFLVDFITQNRDKPFVAYYSMALCHNVTDDLKEPVPFGPQGRYMTYTEMVESTDRQVGKLIAALDRLGAREKTLILFTGDNGTSKSYIHTAVDGKLISKPVFSKINGREVQGGKGELTDGGTRVPLIANWTGAIDAGQVVDDLVDFTDFLPTFADLGGATLPQGVVLDGYSFASRLRGESAAPREVAYCERGAARYWVRTQRWKLYNDGRLFDTQADPQEQRPIAKAGQPPEAAAARQMLEKAQADIRSRSLGTK